MPSCRRCSTHSPSYARFCVNCGTPFGDACPRCGMLTPPDARFCPSCGARRQTEMSPEVIKLATILFADVVGSTARAEKMRPEDAREEITALLTVLVEEIDREEGTVEKVIGDAVTGVFGVPVAHEDDPARAVRAAERMLARIADANEGKPDEERMQIRIGINTGEVSAHGSFGDQLLVVGDAVNVAARLQQLAEPGTIVVGERTARALQRSHQLRAHEPVTVKGKSDALTVFTIGEPLARGRDYATETSPPMIGRDAELEALRDAYSTAREQGRAALVMVIGEPGVGKSRLVEEFSRSIVDEAASVSGRCVAYARGISLAALRDILRTWAGILPSDNAQVVLDKLSSLASRTVSVEHAEGLTHSLALTFGVDVSPVLSQLDPREVQRELRRGWVELLCGLASQGPLLVTIEDLHWADDTMLDVLQQLVQSVHAPVVFVVTTRPDLLVSRPAWVAGLTHHRSIHLDPLSREQTAHLVSLLVGSNDFPQHLVEVVLERTEGNPFFVEEVVRALADEGHVMDQAKAPEFAPLHLPDTVHGAILSRLDRLDPSARLVLQHAGVIGRTFSLTALEHLVPRTDLEDLLGDLVARRFLTVRPALTETGVAFAFRHVLIREVAYESLPRKMRGGAHATLASRLAEAAQAGVGDVAELLAHHYDEAFRLLGSDQLRRRAREYGLLAARNAVRRFTISHAEAFGSRAVELSTGGRERIEALEFLGDLYTLTFKSDGAWRAYTEAIAELDEVGLTDGVRYAHLAAKASIVPTRWRGTMETIPPREDISALIERGLSAVEPGDSRDRSLLLTSQAFLFAWMSESQGAQVEEAHVALAEEAIAIAERLDDADLISAAMDALSALLLAEGRFRDCYRVDSRRATIAPRLTDPREAADAYAMVATSALTIGHYREALDNSDRCVERAKGVDAGSYLHGLVWRVCASFMTGQWGRVLEDQDEIERLQGDPGTLPTNLAMWAYGVAFLCTELRGDIARADQYLALIEEVIADRSRSNRDFHSYLGAPARALAYRGEFDKARSWLRTDRSFYSGSHLEALCEVVRLQGDWDAALNVLSLAREEVRACGLIALGCFADRLEGAAARAQGELARSVSLLRQSAKAFGSLGARWEEALSQLLLAEAHLERGEKDEAQHEITAALATFEALHSPCEMERSLEVLGESRR